LNALLSLESVDKRAVATTNRVAIREPRFHGCRLLGLARRARDDDSRRHLDGDALRSREGHERRRARRSVRSAPRRAAL